ncbi:unnamed protein product [Pieris macdunnoughi]|uniref:Transposase n=1 Tax=Pieris macdunnoughi TaxID=345717 RepID=A0A821Y334_9NEOP|nr:unnamed protein product [Pieris macdunnoughi]
MEKQENRAVMKYFYLKGLTPKEIKEEMDSTLGTSSPSYSTVKHGFPTHTSIVATAKINDLKTKLMPHPPYSPDLAPCDYLLFPNLKKWLGGKRFADNEEVIEAVNGYFEELDESVYRDGINRLEHRYEKCISHGGDYVEKYNFF